MLPVLYAHAGSAKASGPAAVRSEAGKNRAASRPMAARLFVIAVYKLVPDIDVCLEING